ncbi:MAG: VWA domain-containing protein [Prevotella sp.]|nr:VWA domain-containing protein [Staphylococcus sp.]MCM1350084.1 VWA domain-containing protein [Prevotella sp.]
MKKLMTYILMILFVCVMSVSCSTKGPDIYDLVYYPSLGSNDDAFLLNTGESYNELTENPFIHTTYNSDSYFSMDSFTASYANLRRYIQTGMKIPSNIIKTDELINYFRYQLPEPLEGETFGITAQMQTSFWNEETKLLTVGIQTKTEKVETTMGNNFVLLIDVSGSMSSENKLPLLQNAFCLLVDTLSENDCISIVTYASGLKTVLDGGSGDEKVQIKDKIRSLTAKGATYGEQGLRKAYEIAEKHFIPGGNNRVILASDGDFNVGIRTQEELKNFITEKLDAGIYLTTLGVGIGNYKDTTMETLAKYGNGAYAYIDTIEEAKKVLVDEIDQTLVTVAKDVKNKIHFNANVVDSYRLIGYENKQLTEEDFNDENKDAGEVGSGHTTMVCYELVLKQNANLDIESIFDVQINYKDPKTDQSVSAQKEFHHSDLKSVTEDFYFVGALIEFSLALRNSPYKGTANCQSVLERLEQYCSSALKEDAYKQEFYHLVEQAIAHELLPEEESTIILEMHTDYGIKSICLSQYTVLTADRIKQYAYGKKVEGQVLVYLDRAYTILFQKLSVVEDTVVYLRYE